MIVRFRRLKVLGVVMLGVLLVFTATWGVLALLYFDHANLTFRDGLAVAYGLAALATLVALALPRWRWRAVAAYGFLFAVLLGCWFSIKPSNDRAWGSNVAVLANATIDGDLVTIHNIRNFDYRTETDYTPAYYDRTFDLRQLNSVDLITVYWMGPAIAHIMASFGFADGHHLVISIEARSEIGEGYSTIKGFFRQYELYYAVTDERDAIRLRTNYRKDPPEDVYVWRIKLPIEDGRRAFLDYMREVNSLNQHPEFYNTLTTNCATSAWQHARVNADHLPFSWKILLSGYVPEMLYQAGRFGRDVPFEQMREQVHVNERAHAADKDEDFSQRIRAVPDPHPQ